MIMIANVICLGLMVSSICMGLRASVICAPRLKAFTISDLYELFRTPDLFQRPSPFWSWVYPLNTGFVLLECTALVARVNWALNVGWDNAGQDWAMLWLYWHATVAGLILWFHIGIIRVYRAYEVGVRA